MNETLKLILSLSLSGSILAGLLLCMKPLVKHRLSKSIQYYLWVVVLVRLTMPFSFEGSMMNHLVYDKLNWTSAASQGEVMSKTGLLEEVKNSPAIPDTGGTLTLGARNGEADLRAIVIDLINRYVIYIWLIGVLVSLTVHLSGYVRFSKVIRQTSKPGHRWENGLLRILADGNHRVRFVRNPYAATPMLVGVLRPLIVIPDTNYSEVQLKHILLHELTHLKRYDIVIKWFSMIVTSLHWFNPLMYWMRREITRSGELSCDEAVIRKLSPSDKQAYGETLITVATGIKHPSGGLQATFSEEKEILKERLVAIMRPAKKTKMVVILSAAVFAFILFSAAALGGSGGTNSSPSPVEPPSIVINHEEGPGPIENYRILTASWDGKEQVQPTFYYAAWHSEPTLLTGLRRLKPGEKMTLDFGAYPPDQVTVKMAYLTESYEESLLPIQDVSLKHVQGRYEFTNPPAAVSEIGTLGRVFSITASWGTNTCEYVFASDGKFDDMDSNQ